MASIDIAFSRAFLGGFLQFGARINSARPTLRLLWVSLLSGISKGVLGPCHRVD